MSRKLTNLVKDIRECRICKDQPQGSALAHEPRPVLRVSATARIVICGQAPGTRVHESGVPFTDPSGDRLRQWMNVSEDEFYDEARIAILPMGFCFPGLDAKGGDLPPRRECAPRWRAHVFEQLEAAELVLLVGQYAQKWHLGAACASSLTETVRQWRRYADMTPCFIPTPHPSWRNNAWLKRNPWFETEVLVFVQERIRSLLAE